MPSTDPAAGYVLFVRDSTLMAQPFDVRRMELQGRATAVADQIDDNRVGTGGHGSFSASSNVLVFQPKAVRKEQFTWFDRTGKVLGTVGEPGDYLYPATLSPDGKRLAVAKLNAKGSNIWLIDLSQGGEGARLTFSAAEDVDPTWSPDGSSMIYAASPEGRPGQLYRRPTDGSKPEELLLESEGDKHPTSWSSDGRYLLYFFRTTKTREDIWVLPLEGNRKPVPFLTTEASEGRARFSPDGRWVAYQSDESGKMEVYVRSFSMNAAGTAVEPGGKWQISNGSGLQPIWRRDGRELYYRSRDGGVMAADITTSPVFSAGAPHPAGPKPDPKQRFLPAWDVSADGRILLAPVLDAGPQPYTIVLNWQSGLKR